MAGEKKTQAQVAIDIDKELLDAAGRIMEFEQSIQRGEADEDEITRERRIQLREKARQNLKRRSDVQDTVSRAAGRRFIFRILEIAGPNRLSPNISDPLVTAKSEGMRYVANAVLELLYDADPNAYAQMQREHVSDMKTELERKTREMESAPQ